MLRPRPTRCRSERAAAGCHLETLEGRTYFAINAFFVGGRLSVFGDATANQITISRSAGGAILVNGGAVAVRGARPTAANIRRIEVNGLSGDDDLRLDETNGPLPTATILGGPGKDILTGGSGADLLFGQAGNDFLFGQGGVDLMFGGSGDDNLTGGAGDDQNFGQSGNDFLAWAPGDGSDRDEGGDGTDIVIVNGSADNETFALTPNGDHVLLRRTEPVPFSIDIGTAETLTLRTNGGDDIVTASDGLAPLIHLTLDGGAGDDALFGSDGADDLLGRDGNDLLVGNGGNDLMLGGAGDDTFVWNNGDGSDTVEGQNDRDTLMFEGSVADESFNLSANATRARLTRDVGNVDMDHHDLEEVDLDTVGGADTVTVNDQTATGLNTVNIDLGDSGNPTSAADAVVINGTDGNDVGQVRSIGNRVNATISGIPFVNITGEGGLDTLTVNTGGGNDVLDASDLAATNASQLIKLTVNGGPGNDILTGSQGNDTFLWNPGDGSDTVEGGAVEGGTDEDTLTFNGSDLSETFGISANGSHVRLSRDLGNVAMDVHGVERVEVTARGGGDPVVVNDLTGTDVFQNDLDLAATPGAATGDGQSDSVVVNGRAVGTLIPILGLGTGIVVNGGFANGSGLQYFLAMRAVDPADMLQVNGGGGDDTIDASALQTPVTFRAEGRAGNDTLLGTPFGDVLVGGDGDDTVDGNAGNDLAFLGSGDDLFTWDPGDGADVVEGMNGSDTVRFNGGAGGDAFDLSASAGRLAVTRNNNGVIVDADGVDRVDVLPLGGQDNVFVNDLSATAVRSVQVQLSADGTTDRVDVNGSGLGDNVAVFEQAGAPVVILPALTVRVLGADPDKDVLTVNGLGGGDTIDASTLPAGRIRFVADGGDGNDLLVGSAGDDTLLGGEGNDTLRGGPGADTLDGGPGNNVLTQD
jgi:Ca2+-binding RTX toxin-like protein